MKISLLFILMICLCGCWPSRIGFKDTGGMPEEWQKFSVQTLRISAPTCPLNYAAGLSETLKDGIQNNTRLSLTPNINEAQVQISGEITQYTINPIALQNGDNAAKNRLTVSIAFDLNFTSPKIESSKLTVTRFADFNAETNFSSVENQLLSQVNEQVVQDVINKLMSNW